MFLIFYPGIFSYIWIPAILYYNWSGHLCSFLRHSYQFAIGRPLVYVHASFITDVKNSFHLFSTLFYIWISSGG